MSDEVRQEEPRIVSAVVGPKISYMDALLGNLPKVTVTFDNGEEKMLFKYFPDEISFSEPELIGLTESEAKELKYKKDQRYLKSGM